MRNATKHAEDLRSLLRRLSREGKPQPMEPQDPLRALVRAAMSFDMPDAKAEEAMQAINKEFVDLNELRVATDLEIHELLGVRYPAIERRVAMITQSLNAIFEREHTMNLDRLKSVSKRDARQFLRELPDSHPFVEAYIMLFSFEGHAVPMDDLMLDYLRSQKIATDKSTLDDVQKFLEHQLKAEEVYESYYYLRRAAASEGSEAERPRRSRS
jgi:endonuclease III